MNDLANKSLLATISFWTPVRAAFILIVPIGYGFTAARFASLPLEYLLLNAVSAFAFFALAWSLGAPVRQLPACIIAIVFLVCYYLEFYLLVIFPWLSNSVPLPPNIHGFSLEYYFECFGTMTSGLVAFTAVTVLWAPNIGATESDRRGSAVSSQYNMKPALGVAAALAVAYFWFNISFDVVASGVIPNLAYHLFGVVEFSFSIMAAMLLLMVIDAAMKWRNPKLGRIAFAIWLPPLLYTTFIITSKGAILTFVLELFFLWLLGGGKLNRRTVVFGIVGVAIGCICFPVINAIRVLRVNEGMSTGQAVSLLLAGSSSLSEALRAVAARNGGSVVTSILIQILGRLTGANVLLPIGELRYSFLGWNTVRIASGTHGIAGYFTSQMLGLGDLAAEKISSAMGMLGIFWIIDGNSAVIVGVAGFTTMILIIWHYLPRLTGVSTRAAQATLLMLVSGGALDGSLQQMTFHVLPFWAGSVVLCEWIGRMGVRRQQAPRRVGRFAPAGAAGEP